MDAITVDQAEDALYAGPIAKQLVSEHRWYTKYLIVIEDDNGGLYGFHYDEPATETQEGQDRFEAVPVPVFPVTSKRVVTTVYEKQRTDIKAQ